MYCKRCHVLLGVKVTAAAVLQKKLLCGHVSTGETGIIGAGAAVGSFFCGFGVVMDQLGVVWWGAVVDITRCDGEVRGEYSSSSSS